MKYLSFLDHVNIRFTEHFVSKEAKNATLLDEIIELKMERFHYRWKLHLHNYQISLIPFFCFVLILLKLSITKSICAQFALAAYFRQENHNFLFSGVNVL